MTNEDIVRMAREAGVEGYGPTTMYPEGYSVFAGCLERFAALVAAAAKAEEREACAREIEIPYYGDGGKECATAIRARQSL